MSLDDARELWLRREIAKLEGDATRALIYRPELTARASARERRIRTMRGELERIEARRRDT